MNGFLNKDGVKPATGAWEYLYFQDKNVANVKNPYSPTFEFLGVRFEFDAEKLAGRTYKYFDVASKTFKDGAVTLSTDNTNCTLQVNWLQQLTIIRTTSVQMQIIL